MLKISNPSGPTSGNGKEQPGSTSIRDNRGKAKQYTTLNGKTVVIKDSYVYSNKGFRNLNQAQLIQDALYYHDGLEAQQWLIYYISRPLLGSPETIERPIAVLPVDRKSKDQSQDHKGVEDGIDSPESRGKQNIKTFGDLLSKFPLIARQMHAGLERVFLDFHSEAGRPLPASSRAGIHSRNSSRSSVAASSKSGSSVSKRRANGHRKTGSISSINTIRSTYADEEEDNMRKALENAVSTAIDLFQQVDKQQLSLLGSTTELTGPDVERLLEKHVAEQVHDSVLFPRLCDIHETEDVDLDSGIQRMYYVDIGQVGVEFDGGFKGKGELSARIRAGIEEFRKVGNASSPQQMVETLLETTKIISGQNEDTSSNDPPGSAGLSVANLTMNADTLVSMLLIVVIRSNVKHLQARLHYMRNFVFIDDVDGGEMGYALSTFEAVLAYLTTDSGGLRIASRRNRRLWHAIKKGNLSELRTILEPDDGSLSDESDSLLSYPDDSEEPPIVTNGTSLEPAAFTPPVSEPETAPELEPEPAPAPDLQEGFSQASTEVVSRPSTGTNLSHVFPFQGNGPETSISADRPKLIKRVSWSRRSLSNVSEFSFGSRTSTIASRASFIEGDTSIEKLCQTQDHAGNSVLMMAIRARQPESLAYLLSLEEFFSHEDVMEDADEDGTTLLSAAVQSANLTLVDVFVDLLFEVPDYHQIRSYVAKEDKYGRTMAHYLFHAPELMSRFRELLPWRKKDKNGQTPLLALCRCYDHAHYLQMVNEALQLATVEQNDGLPLHADNHIDNKGNTLLHVVSDAHLALRMLQHCDADPNAPNDKKFTPLMVASKFGRFDLVRALFLDKRTDYMAKEHRGMTAVELAKDDDVRNRIDDMVLVSNIPTAEGKVSAVVRAFFMDDSSVRLVIKSASRYGDGMISITTSRRSLSDFEQLTKWLSVEHPASWIPSVEGYRLPYQIPSRPSRAVLQDVHLRLDKFLRTLLEHPTFANHELVWEFILVPEIQPDVWAARSTKKAAVNRENIIEEYEPMTEFRDVESFVAHARESLRNLSQGTRSVIRRTTAVKNTSSDLYTAFHLANSQVTALQFLPPSHSLAYTKFYHSWLVRESDPYTLLHSTLIAIHSTTTAMLTTLTKPLQHITTIRSLAGHLDRHAANLRRSDRWQFGLLEETRNKNQQEIRKKLDSTKRDILAEGSLLRFTQQTVASELAAWHELHARMARRAIRRFAEGVLVRERERLEGMKRALRTAREGVI